MEQNQNNDRERVFETQRKGIIREAYPGKRNKIKLNRSLEGLEDYVRRKSFVGFERLHVFIIKGTNYIIGQDPLINEVILGRERNYL